MELNLFQLQQKQMSNIHDSTDSSSFYSDHSSQKQRNVATTEVFTVDGVLNDGEWTPSEEREYTWILHNHNNRPLKMKAKLQCMGEKNGVTIREEGVYLTYEGKADEEFHVVVHVRAPPLCGKYNCVWKLINENNMEIDVPLEMKLIVQTNLKLWQEVEVSKIIKMGFRDRDSVVAALLANKWESNLAVLQLSEQQR